MHRQLEANYCIMQLTTNVKNFDGKVWTNYMDTIIRLIHVLFFMQNMPILRTMEELWCAAMTQILQ